MSYEKLINIKDLNFEDKRVLLIGGGWMGKQYCVALKVMKIKDVTIVTRTKKTASECQRQFGYTASEGGYKKVVSKLEHPFDLVIVATPVHTLKSIAMFVAHCGNRNILVEKPGSLYSSVIEKWSKEINDTDIRIRIAYNRLVYPSLWKSKGLVNVEGGITSCFYTFTEWVRTINFNNNQPDCYRRWGVANSLHVISMAHSLIGFPKQICTYRSSSFPWHPTGARFVGAGITKSNIPFSYHADWESAGRWGIEIMTSHNVYRMMPLEQLYYCPKGSTDWKPIEISPAYPQVKIGVAEEIAVMLDKSLETFIPLVTLKKAALFTKFAENIFGYSSFLLDSKKSEGNKNLREIQQIKQGTYKE